jgi:hypothetical protein
MKLIKKKSQGIKQKTLTNNEPKELCVAKILNKNYTIF